MTTLSNKEQCIELARLMREGAAKTLPYKNGFYARSKFAEYTCALGAVLYTRDELNCLSRLGVLLGVYPVLGKGLVDTIIDKNTAGIPREEIANWLESLEWND